MKLVLKLKYHQVTSKLTEMYKYLYIDDTFDKLELGTVNGLQQGGEIEVKYMPPGPWEEKIIELVKILPDYNGLIIDLRLNDKPYEGNKKAQYRGSTVAQEIRTLVKEKKIVKDLPIFLISADQKLEESLDKTSYDLFDYVISKNTLGNDETGIGYKEFILMLKSFADGYTFIEEKKDLESLFGKDKAKNLDTRFINEITSLFEHPNHVIVRFINKLFLTKTTSLINEEILAARLGVNILDKNWSSFKETYMATFKYDGILGLYFERWWWPEIENWWIENISDENSIRSLTAKQRVDILNSKTGLNLEIQSKSEKSHSEKFWTVCKARKIPIDTVDGFLITGQDNFYPWQEKEYISLDEALRPKEIEKWKDIATTEYNRLKKLKDFYENAEQRIRR